MSLKTIWSTQQVPNLPEIHIETLPRGGRGGGESFVLVGLKEIRYRHGGKGGGGERRECSLELIIKP